MNYGIGVTWRGSTWEQKESFFFFFFKTLLQTLVVCMFLGGRTHLPRVFELREVKQKSEDGDEERKRKMRTYAEFQSRLDEILLKGSSFVMFVLWRYTHTHNDRLARKINLVMWFTEGRESLGRRLISIAHITYFENARLLFLANMSRYFSSYSPILSLIPFVRPRALTST